MQVGLAKNSRGKERRKGGDTKEPPEEKWKRHMEGDIAGDMTGHILLEGGALWLEQVCL